MSDSERRGEGIGGRPWRALGGGFLEHLVESHDLPGDSVSAHGFTATPWSRAIVIRLPFARFVWHRPIGVDVTRGGPTRRLPIADPNRAARMAVLAALILFAVAFAGMAASGERKGRRTGAVHSHRRTPARRDRPVAGGGDSAVGTLKNPRSGWIKNGLGGVVGDRIDDASRTRWKGD